MARSMGEDGDAFRVMIVFTGWHGEQRTVFEGPYATIGAARGRIPWAERSYGKRLISTKVEKSSTNWQPVD